MKFFKVFSILAAILLLFGCKSELTNPGQPTELITNSSFEVDGTPSLQGWTVCDGGYDHFSHDVPPGMAGTSIYVEAGDMVYTPVHLPEGNIKIQATCWLKALHGDAGFGMYKIRSGYEEWLLGYAIEDTAWTFITKTFLVESHGNDSLHFFVGFRRVDDMSETWCYNPHVQIIQVIPFYR
jgi:hypothetical protein